MQIFEWSLTQKMKHFHVEKNSFFRDTIKRMSRAKEKGSNLVQHFS